MGEMPALFAKHSLDWLAGAGEAEPNFSDWAQIQAGHPSALGMMTTQWHSGGDAPYIKGIAPLGAAGWNRRNASKTHGCAKKLKADDASIFDVVWNSDLSLHCQAINKTLRHLVLSSIEFSTGSTSPIPSNE